MSSKLPRTPTFRLVLHPLARPAFEVLAELGTALIPSGAARVVAGPDRTLLVFAGLPWLWSDTQEVPVLRDAGLGDDAIRSAAWAEVVAVMTLLKVPAPDRAAFVRAAATGAPDDLLDRFGLPGTRDPDRVFRKLKVPARMRAPVEQPRVIDRVRARFRDGS